MTRAYWIICLMVAMLAPATHAQELFNVALTDLGATATGTGAPFNKDWPAINAIGPQNARGTLFGTPMTGGRVDIKLIQPVDIKAIETTGLDYNGTRQAKAIDIFVDGKLVKQAELPETPGKPVRIPLDARGREVAITVTAEHDIRTLANGRQGPNYGGWRRIAVLSPTDISYLMKPPAGYEVSTLPDFIAPTQGVVAEGAVKVIGQPRQAQGWPRTLWDKQDVQHYRNLLKTSRELQSQYAALQKAMDFRLTQPVGVPEPRQDAEGKWIHLPEREVGKIHNALSLDIANLGTMYQLSGDDRYGEFAKQILLAYAKAYPNYGVGSRPGFNHDPSRLFDQRLSDATWLIQVARGYDLIHDLPSITAEERNSIETDLLRASAEFIAANRAMLISATNWSAIATTSILITGYAIDAPDLVDLARWGRNGTPEKPTGGVHLHFSERSIDLDGLWSEGSTGYQMMAMEALVTVAEILWRHGVDMYGYRDGALKSLFDSPLRFAYPDLRTPAIHDGGGGSIVGYEAHLWEFAYLRYGDPKYLTILSRASKNLAAQFQKFPVSILYDQDISAAAPPMEWKSFNFFGVGFGINRITTPDGNVVSMLLDYGPNRSHGHPDKLNVDLYALDQVILPDPGSVWYEQPIYKNWYATTLSHNTLVVDELSQKGAAGTQLVYGFSETLSLQRATTDTAYPGVTMDRALFLTSEYMADIFGAFSQTPRTMDLAWHLVGDMQTSLPLQDTTLSEPRKAGYSELTDLKRATTDQAWHATVNTRNGVARFVAAGGTPTDIVIGNGHLRTQNPPTIIQRRDNTKLTLYANALDISSAQEPFVRGVASEGGLEAGYGLLKLDTARGTDLCFTAYRPGTHRAAGLETDALQAHILQDADQVRAMFLGGGTTLKFNAVSLTRSEAGLAYIEKIETGAYIVGNPSGTAATLTVAFPAIANLQSYALDLDGKRTGPADVKTANGAITLTLAPASRVEFAPAGVASGYDHRQQLLLQKQQQQAAAEAALLQESTQRSQTRQQEAAANPVPANTILFIQAENFSTQGGGSVNIATNKTASVGDSFSGWDNIGHWLEWTVNAPVAGHYNLTLCYCTVHADAVREIMVNGENQEPGSPLRAEGTHGWANGSDDWALVTPTDTISNMPLLIELKQGENTIRLTNTDARGMNLDYLLITSPDVKPTREMAK